MESKNRNADKNDKNVEKIKLNKTASRKLNKRFTIDHNNSNQLNNH